MAKDITEDPTFVLKAIRKGLYGADGIHIVGTYMIDGNNPRLDNYQLIKMNRVIMAQLFDISERLKVLEKEQTSKVKTHV